MIRKNAVESILAERNILISVRNPFVVSVIYFLLKFALYLKYPSTKILALICLLFYLG
jgi:hypothetical protein